MPQLAYTQQHVRAGALSGSGTGHVMVTVASDEHAFLEGHFKPSDTRFLLGERAFITAFLDWASARCNVQLLGRLRLPATKVQYHDALRLHEELRAVRRMCESSDAAGLGVYTHDHSAPVRALMCDSPRLQMQSSTTTLETGPEGLVLRNARADRPTLNSIAAWDLSQASATVLSTNGLDELTNEEAMLLSALGRGASQAEVRWTPLRQLASPLLEFLYEASELAGERRSGLSVWTATPGVVEPASAAR